MPPQAIFQPTLLGMFDVFQYYKNVAAFSVFVDIILLCMMFGWLMREGAQRARMSTRFGGMLGVIMGASIAYAIHEAGYKLLTHWMPALILMLTCGVAAYRMSREAVGRPVALAFGILVSMFIAYLYASTVFFPSWLTPYFGMLLFVGLIILIIGGAAHIVGRMRAGGAGGGAGGGGGGRGGGGGGGPDLTPIIAAIAELGRRLDANAGALGAAIGDLQRNMGDFRQLLLRILDQINDLTREFRGWETWFDRIGRHLNDIEAEVRNQGGITRARINEIETNLRNQIQQFRDFVTQTLATLEGTLGQANNTINNVHRDLGQVRTDQQTMARDVTSISGRLDQLRASVADLERAGNANAQDCRDRLGRVEALVNTINTNLGQVQGLQASMQAIEDQLRRMGAPDLSNITQQIAGIGRDLGARIDTLNQRIDGIVAAANRNPRDVPNITQTVTQTNQADREVREQIDRIVAQLENLRTLGPALQQLVQAFPQPVIESVQQLPAHVQSLQRLAQELEQAIQRAQAAAAPAGVPDLGSVYTILDTQSNILLGIRTQLGAFLEQLPTVLNPVSKADAQNQLQTAIATAAAQARLEVDPVRVALAQIIDTARPAVEAHRQALSTTRVVEVPMLTELNRHLESFAHRRADVERLTTLQAELLGIGRALVDRSRADPVPPDDIIKAFDAYTLPIIQALQELAVVRQGARTAMAAHRMRQAAVARAP